MTPAPAAAPSPPIDAALVAFKDRMRLREATLRSIKHFFDQGLLTEEERAREVINAMK
jgi:hypothetical protein